MNCVSYRPGWDCHGLPIEIKALEQIRVSFQAENQFFCMIDGIFFFAIRKKERKQPYHPRTFAKLLERKPCLKSTNNAIVSRVGASWATGKTPT